MSGLNRNASYSLVLYGFASAFTVAGGTVNTLDNQNITFVNGDNYAEFTGLAAPGVQIASSVPEASSSVGLGVMLTLGGLTIVARKSRGKA